MGIYCIYLKDTSYRGTACSTGFYSLMNRFLFSYCHIVGGRCLWVKVYFTSFITSAAAHTHIEVAMW